MPAYLDIALVSFAVACALGYLLYRKLRSARHVSRDWATGHAEACGNCAVIEIRRRQLMAKK